MKLTRNSIALIMCMTTLMGCQPDQSMDFNLQGHRGARGFLPENTIPSFLLAAEQGADTIEMDVVVSSDSQVVVSHEPWMSARICSHPDGSPVTEEEEAVLNLFRMTAAEISAFDCGSRGHPDFPEQKPIAVHKPLLREALSVLETEYDGTLGYNIEIKSRPESDGVHHPVVSDFAALLYAVVSDAGTVDRTTFQSFDPRALEVLHGINPEATLALLVSNQDSLEANLARLSFLPQIYSPHHELVDAELVDQVHSRGMIIIPWTVNDQADMLRLLEIGVDGFITDYPSLGAELKDRPTPNP